MKNVILTAIAAILLATGFTAANAQNSNPTPSPVTQNDLRHTQKVLAKELRKAEAQRTADDERTAQQLNGVKGRQEFAQQAINAEQQAEAKANAERAASDAKVGKFELEFMGAFASAIIIMISVMAWIIAKIVKSRGKTVTIPSLRTNAISQEIQTYVEENGLLGKTIPYSVDVILDPKYPDVKKRVDGQIRNAGVNNEYEFEGFRTTNSQNRFDTARKALEAQKEIHNVKRA